MNKQGRQLICGGIICVLLLLISTWDAVTFNDARLVAPMDFGSYTFQIRDLPMVISLLLVCVYVLIAFVVLCFGIVRGKRAKTDRNRTRRLNPKMGWLGLLGFGGFAGFWTYSVDQSVFPFAFFLFFGFFGFFFEGKMSGTYMDERFRANAARAQLTALKVTCSIVFFALIVLCQGKLFGSFEHTLIAAVVLLALALALGGFLSEYLLYRYDHDDQYDGYEE